MTFKIKIATWNANGIINKIDETKTFLMTEKIDIMIINETKLTSNDKLYFNNYKTYRQDRPTNTRAGGVAIIIKSDIAHRQIKNDNTNSIETSAKQSATPAAPVRPSAPKTAPATKTANNDNASKSFADAASSKKTAPPAPPQATPKQPPAIGKALTEILKAIQTSNTKEEILQNVLAIIPKILLDC
jgi:hypothetical protein